MLVVGMKNLNAAILGDAGFAGQLGKKGSASDFTIYNYHGSDSTIQFCEPTLYPDKIQPLLMALAYADYVVLVAKHVDRALGEQILAVDNFGIGRGCIALDGVFEEQLAPFLKGTSLEKFEIVEKNAQSVIEKALALSPARAEGPFKMPVDQCFAVKSVGTVALGFAERGSAKINEQMELAPTGKLVTPRSFQVHDKDFPEVNAGERVGVALRGIESEEVERGFVLSVPGTIKSASKISAEIKLTKFAKPISAGETLFVSVGWQYAQANVANISGSTLALETAKPVAFEAGERMVVVRPEAMPRIVGNGKILS